MEKYLIALDQGTTSSRCIVFDKKGNMKAVTQREFTQYYPENGWVEQDAGEIWATELGVLTEAMATLNLSPHDVAAIGITNQRETTIVWDKVTGEPIYRAIVWQCRRTADEIEALKAEGYDKVILEKTGLIADPYFSATKLKWILDHVEGARERAKKGELLFGTVDTWLIWKLTKGRVHATDYTNASRTMLFNIHELCWDKELLDKFDIPKKMLPEVKDSSCIYGYTDTTVAGGDIPIAGVAGDQQAALFGQCCFRPGQAKNTYGTGCFLLMNIGDEAKPSKNGLVTTIAIGLNGKVQYALEGSVFVAGAAVQWLRDEMGLITNAAETETIANSVSDSNGVYVVPAFTGLGAPYWDAYARGAIFGLTRGANRAHIVRATLESLAYQVSDVLSAMETDSGMRLSDLRVDGGASANNFLLQFQADILDTDIIRPKVIETTALGAAYLAGLAVGFYKDLNEIEKNVEIERVFKPEINKSLREERLEGWKKCIERLR
ncbi:MAG: glycerol kinase GlpK [Lachnospiraceae bacterium]|nr:glycerol kinase GlpK [Lachnospiraceae bacterium]